MSMLTNLDLICRVPLFALLSKAQAQAMAQAVTKRRFRRGECLVTQGQKSPDLFIILSGRARVVMTDNQQREVILATLGVGDCVGEMSLIDNEPHSASVMAEVQTDVLVLGRTEFLVSLKDSAALSLAIMRGLVQRLRQADRKIGSLALMSVYGRVAGVLLERAHQSSTQDMVIHEKISRQDIAKMVGASREMVSRVMKDFEGQGFITTLDNGSIRVKERRAKPR